MVAKRVQHIALNNTLLRNVAIIWPGLDDIRDWYCQAVC